MDEVMGWVVAGGRTFHCGHLRGYTSIVGQHSLPTKGSLIESHDNETEVTPMCFVGSRQVASAFGYLGRSLGNGSSVHKTQQPVASCSATRDSCRRTRFTRCGHVNRPNARSCQAAPAQTHVFAPAHVVPTTNPNGSFRLLDTPYLGM